MKCLLVIDMQEDYIGDKRNKKRYSYDVENLIKNVNCRIQMYPTEYVIYVNNKFIWEFKSSPKEFVKELNVISENKYEKRRSSCFSNLDFVNFLNDIDIDFLELVGVDGNLCIASTALDGIKKGFSIVCNEKCLGVGNKKKFTKTKMKLISAGVRFI